MHRAEVGQFVAELPGQQGGRRSPCLELERYALDCQRGRGLDARDPASRRHGDAGIAIGRKAGIIDAEAGDRTAKSEFSLSFAQLGQICTHERPEDLARWPPETHRQVQFGGPQVVGDQRSDLALRADCQLVRGAEIQLEVGEPVTLVTSDETAGRMDRAKLRGVWVEKVQQGPALRHPRRERDVRRQVESAISGQSADRAAALEMERADIPGVDLQSSGFDPLIGRRQLGEAAQRAQPGRIEAQLIGECRRVGDVERRRQTEALQPHASRDGSSDAAGEPQPAAARAPNVG